jgi:hypothetical protein
MNGKAGVYNIWPKVAPELQMAIGRVTDSVIARHRRWLKRRGIVMDCTVWEMTGCTTVQFCEHISGKFEPAMNWLNFGKWQIDHIHPLAAVDPSSTEAILGAFHFANLRPSWASENSRKGAKVTTPLVTRSVLVRNYGSRSERLEAYDLRLG